MSCQTEHSAEPSSALELVFSRYPENRTAVSPFLAFLSLAGIITTDDDDEEEEKGRVREGANAARDAATLKGSSGGNKRPERALIDADEIKE